MSEPARTPPEALENVSATRRTPPVIDPQAFMWNGQTYAAWREAMVRCPPGLVPADLHEHPGIVWKKVQANHNTSLQRFDRVLIVGDGEEWCVDALVVDADRTKVTLGNFKITTLTARSEKYVTPDGLFTVIWSGPGYQAYRLQDGGRPPVPMSIGIFDSFEHCKMKLHEAAYPKRL
jgi:hypothetical protein